MQRPRIAVCGLNPHNGDNGAFGREEIDVIGPAVERRAGAACRRTARSRPTPSSCARSKEDGSREVDAIVTMYHDQGQIAMKLMGFSRGVTVHGGLPIPITTPAHGTAFDIQGQGKASVGALQAGLRSRLRHGGRGGRLADTPRTMMTVESYLLFVSASIVLCVVPGPDMVYLLSRCVAQGRRAGLMAALGINLGAYVHLIAAVLGLSAILLTSSLAFTLVKWAGAAYLIYLGAQALLSRSKPLSLDPRGLKRHSDRAIFWQGFLSDVLNPKVAMFFLALLPQFIDAQGPDPMFQLLLLGITVNVIGLVINLLLVFLSAWITEALRRNDTVAGWLHKAMGAVFVYLGIRLVGERT